MLLSSAFLLGLFGSIHCIGMCGPIALAVTGKNHLLQHKILYNLGRTSTYIFLGGFFGLLGMGISLAGSQKFISISMGIILIIAAILTLPYWRIKFRILEWVVVKVKIGMSKYLKSKSFAAPYLIGIINGFLPCGLVYIAIAGAIASGGVLSGAAYMGLFGLGTIPAILALATSWSVLKSSSKINVQKVIPIFVSLLGILFILRGLELGIPFISPILYGTEIITECQ